jgi:hypothetical protein
MRTTIFSAFPAFSARLAFAANGVTACAQCGRPGGKEWNYDGMEVRRHEQCERPWIDAHEGR